MFLISVVGNRSLIKALKRGRSYFKNFGIFESLIALMSTLYSLESLSALLREPAITNTLLTALIPKS